MSHLCHSLFPITVETKLWAILHQTNGLGNSVGISLSRELTSEGHLGCTWVAMYPRWPWCTHSSCHIKMSKVATYGVVYNLTAATNIQDAPWLYIQANLNQFNDSCVHTLCMVCTYIHHWTLVVKVEHLRLLLYLVVVEEVSTTTGVYETVLSLYPNISLR